MKRRIVDLSYLLFVGALLAGAGLFVFAIPGVAKILGMIVVFFTAVAALFAGLLAVIEFTFDARAGAAQRKQTGSIRLAKTFGRG